jgi:predicted kinase
MIIIVFGLPGSGKSYFASKLAKRLEAKYVNSDVIRKQLFDTIEYSKEEKMKVYEVMMKVMIKAVRQSENIVLDATFYKENLRKKFLETATALDERILFIEVWAEEEIIFERLKLKRTYSDADYSVYRRIKEIFEPLKAEHLKVQSRQKNIDEMIKKTLKYIQNYHG